MENDWKVVTVKDLIGDKFDDEFETWDMSEIQQLVSELQNLDIFDIAHSEKMQLRALRCADLITGYLGKIVKLSSYYEAKANKVKYSVALDYKSTEGKTTQESRKWAGEASDELMEVEIKLAKIKGTKALLEKKFEIIIRMFHSIKDVASGLRKSLPMNS